MNKEEKGCAHAYNHNTRPRTHRHTNLLMTTYCGKMPQFSKQNMALISNLDVYDNHISFLIYLLGQPVIFLMWSGLTTVLTICKYTYYSVVKSSSYIYIFK